jgi:hypothetical protein
MTRHDPAPVDADPPCRTDPELFFADRSPVRTAEAKEICQTRCKWLDDCLTYALTVDAYGVWGGMDRRERRAIQKERGLRVQPMQIAPPRRDVYGGAA